MKEDSRINVINALWNYVKINGLQDKVDRRTVRTNDELRAVCPLPITKPRPY
jgi:SWI/SNF-related matrix-associated actin-dependent regulator of chromatin subfamily D